MSSSAKPSIKDPLQLAEIAERAAQALNVAAAQEAGQAGQVKKNHRARSGDV